MSHKGNKEAIKSCRTSGKNSQEIEDKAINPGGAVKFGHILHALEKNTTCISEFCAIPNTGDDKTPDPSTISNELSTEPKASHKQNFDSTPEMTVEIKDVVSF